MDKIKKFYSTHEEEVLWAITIITTIAAIDCAYKVGEWNGAKKLMIDIFKSINKN